MRGVLRLALAVCALATFIHAAGTAWAQDKPLRVALMPFTNTMRLMEMYQPLRESLQATLGRPVYLLTAADYESYFRLMREQGYDIAVTGPHFGAWAIAHGARPLLRYGPTLKPILVVRADSPITSPLDLHGKVLTLSNRLSVSSITGQAWLAGLGLTEGRDYRLTVSPTHTTAIMSVVMGEADAAITTHTPVQQAPEDTRKAIRVIESPKGFPHLFTIASPTMPAEQAERVKAALLTFADTAAGKDFLESSGYRSYRDISAEDLESLRGPVSLLSTIVPEAAQ